VHIELRMIGSCTHPCTHPMPSSALFFTAGWDYVHELVLLEILF
jgi:hypothetical protein